MTSIFELEHLVEAGEQICTMGEYAGVEKRLNDLVEAGYATRTQIYTSPESGAPVYLYKPTQKGLDRLEDDDPLLEYWENYDRDERPGQLLG